MKIVNMLLLLIVLCSAGFSQGGTWVNDQGEIFTLPELGGILVEDGEQLKFMMVMDSDRRPEGYADIDAKAEDILLMLNGNRIKSIADVRGLYEALAVGEEVKLGLKRDKQMFISSFAKMNPENAPRMMIAVESSDEGDEGGRKRIMMNGASLDADDMHPLVGLGIMVLSKDGNLSIKRMRPGKGDNKVQDGDALVSINGTALQSMDQFRKAYDGLSVGANFTLTVKRDGRAISESLVKPDASDAVRIERRQEN